MKETIYCKSCNKEIDLLENTCVQKNERWDLFCTECYTWLGGMLDLLGWEIELDQNIQKSKSENKTMQRTLLGGSMNTNRQEDDEDDDECSCKKEDLHTHDYYIRLMHKNRTIFLFDMINNCSAEMVCSLIQGMNILDSTKPITIEINSPGGSITDGLAILDCIQSSKAPIYTIITGGASSMAGLLSIAGKKRYMTKNAVWMMHSSSDVIGDYLTHIKDRTKFMIKLEKQMDLIMQSKTKLSKNQFNTIRNGELWLFSEDALRYGIVDKII
jgi:ATP-dependent Clp protease protease subunit